jgi:hypothetical protein
LIEILNNTDSDPNETPWEHHMNTVYKDEEKLEGKIGSLYSMEQQTEISDSM